jgi:predicted GIY-YIG superfamily endonuclease
MFTVYILRGGSGRHYIGMTSNMEIRFRQHCEGHTHTTKRLGGDLVIVARRAYETRFEAEVIERKLKSWKNPAKAILYLNSTE